MTELAKFEAGPSAAIRETLARELAKYAAPVALILLCELVAATFLIATISKSASDHLWIDEVLAVWTARLHSPSDIISAIWNGAEFSPPSYDLFLHFLFKTFGSDRLVARLPSIVAVLVSATTLGVIVWRRLGAVSAAMTFGLVLNSFLFEFAIQARPYATLMAITSLALHVWSSRKPEGGSWWQAAALAFLLFASVSLHFYAVVSIAIFGLMELLWSLAQRRIRLPIWVGLVGGACASLVWLPLMFHLSGYNSNDTTASDFYGAPTASHLVRDVFVLFTGAEVFLLFILATVLVVSAAYVASLVLRGPQPLPAPPKQVDSNEVQIAIMGFALLMAWPVGFAFASCVTHVFLGRYALSASIGAILLFVMALRKVPYQSSVGVILLAVLCILPLFRASPKDWSAPALDLLHHSQTAGPIVVSDGDLFLELTESSEPALRSRLVYLRSPDGLGGGDSSGEHQVERLFRSFRSDLPVQDVDAFIAQHPTFVDVGRPGRPTDDLSAWFMAKGWISGVIGMKSGVALFDVNTSRSVR